MGRGRGEGWEYAGEGMVGAEGGRGQKRVGQAKGREGTDKERGVDGDERVVEKRVKGEGRREGRRWGRVA